MPPRNPTTRFTWDDAAGQYRGANGQFVARLTIRHAIDQAIRGSQRTIQQLASQLQAGELPLGVWQEQTALVLKDMHLYSAAAARGGWHAMTPADYGRAGAALKKQYRYLRGFAEDIQAGNVALDGRFLRRAAMYADAARMTYEAQVVATADEAGYTEYRNLLHPADHCQGCLEATDAGWVALGELVPIGERDCIVNDRCTYDFR